HEGGEAAAPGQRAAPEAVLVLEVHQVRRVRTRQRRLVVRQRLDGNQLHGDVIRERLRERLRVSRDAAALPGAGNEGEAHGKVRGPGSEVRGPGKSEVRGRKAGVGT